MAFARRGKRRGASRGRSRSRGRSSSRRPSAKRRTTRRAPSRASSGRRAGTSTRRGMAPVSVGTVAHTRQSAGSVKVSHAETSSIPVFSDTGGGFQQYGVFAMTARQAGMPNGTQFDVMKWLGRFATLYEQQRVWSMVVEYTPFCSSSTQGQLIMGYSPDATTDENSFPDLQSISALEYSVQGSLWQPIKFVVPVKSLGSPDGWKTVPRFDQSLAYVGQAGGALTGQVGLQGNNMGVYGGGIQQFSYGNLYISTFGTSAGQQYGTLRFSYQWEFRCPDNPDAIAETMNNTVASSITATELAPLGASTLWQEPGNFKGTQLLFQPDPGLATRIGFGETGHYMLVCRIVGVGLLDPIFSPSAGVQVGNKFTVFNGAGNRMVVVCLFNVTQGPTIAHFDWNSNGSTYTENRWHIAAIQASCFY